MPVAPSDVDLVTGRRRSVHSPSSVGVTLSVSKTCNDCRRSASLTCAARRRRNHPNPWRRRARPFRVRDQTATALGAAEVFASCATVALVGICKSWRLQTLDQPRVPADVASVDYPALAWALLQQGDTPPTVVAFLCAEYGLDADRAKAAVIMAHTLNEETRPARPRRPRTRSHNGRSRPKA
jgi:hypothetical protein